MFIEGHPAKKIFDFGIDLTISSGWLAAWLAGCLASWLSDCLDVWMSVNFLNYLLTVTKHNAINNMFMEGGTSRQKNI